MGIGGALDNDVGRQIKPTQNNKKRLNVTGTTCSVLLEMDRFQENVLLRDDGIHLCQEVPFVEVEGEGKTRLGAMGLKKIKIQENVP